jgi:tRNA pseudouridine55 synthase
MEMKEGRPPFSSLNGILVIDKERGPSSNGVLQQVRRILGKVKAGHAGTLDPEAEGVLLVCIGQGTKLVPFLADLEKEYVGRARFGEERDTQDFTGRIVGSGPVDHLTEKRISDEMQAFVGETEQKPPMYSAVKVGGERLYRLARRGETVERSFRTISVEAFDLQGWQSPEARFLVRCGSGTYVRTLCADLGKRCGTVAHMTALKRTAVGPFRADEALRVEDVAALASDPSRRLPFVAPADCLPHLPTLRLSPEGAIMVRSGRLPDAVGEELPGDVSPGTPVKLVDPEGGLAAVAICGEEEGFRLRRVFT